MLGKIVEIYCCRCPSWSLRIEDAWDLLQGIKYNSPEKFTKIISLLKVEDIFNKEAEEVAYILSSIVVAIYEDSAGIEQ